MIPYDSLPIRFLSLTKVDQGAQGIPGPFFQWKTCQWLSSQGWQVRDLVVANRLSDMFRKSGLFHPKSIKNLKKPAKLSQVLFILQKPPKIPPKNRKHPTSSEKKRKKTEWPPEIPKSSRRLLPCQSRLRRGDRGGGAARRFQWDALGRLRRGLLCTLVGFFSGKNRGKPWKTYGPRENRRFFEIFQGIRGDLEQLWNTRPYKTAIPYNWTWCIFGMAIVRLVLFPWESHLALRCTFLASFFEGCSLTEHERKDLGMISNWLCHLCPKIRGYIVITCQGNSHLNWTIINLKIVDDFWIFTPRCG